MGIDYANGWDVVVAATFTNIDRLLALAWEQNVTPHQGSGAFSVTVGPATIPAVVSGAQMGAWTMTGGTGQNVVVAVPFTGGTATIGTNHCELAGMVLNVTLLLRAVRSSVDGGSFQLTITLADPSAVVAVGLANPPPGLTAADLDVLNITLRNLLQATAGTAVPVATLPLGQLSAFPWLVPSVVEYAAETTAGIAGGGALAMLMATTHPPPGAPPTLLDGTIPPGCDGALIVSNDIFARRFLAPAVASSLGVDVGQMTFGGGTPTSVLFSGEASTGGGTITSATATAENDSIALVLQGNASPTSGVTVDFTINATYGLALGGTPAQPVLSFQRTSQTESHSTDVAWWVYVVSGLTGGAVGMLVVTVIQQVVDHAAGNQLSGSMPAGFTSSITWPFSGTIAITRALLPLPLQLGGTVA